VKVVAAPIEPFINSRRFSDFIFFSSFCVCRLDGVFDICKSDFSKSVLFKIYNAFFYKKAGTRKEDNTTVEITQAENLISPQKYQTARKVLERSCYRRWFSA
jgi:hypothetical protein